MHVWLYVCMYVCMQVSVLIYVLNFVFMYVYMSIRMYAIMYEFICWASKYGSFFSMFFYFFVTLLHVRFNVAMMTLMFLSMHLSTCFQTNARMLIMIGMIYCWINAYFCRIKNSCSTILGCSNGIVVRLEVVSEVFIIVVVLFVEAVVPFFGIVVYVLLRFTQLFYFVSSWGCWIRSNYGMSYCSAALYTV
jgi:hypothetical protein